MFISVLTMCQATEITYIITQSKFIYLLNQDIKIKIGQLHFTILQLIVFELPKQISI